MQITLTEAFMETEVEGYTAAFATGEVAVFILKESTKDYPQLADMDFAGYKEAVLKANQPQGAAKELKEEDGLTIIEYDYENPDTKDTYSYLTTLHQEKEGFFWLVQFASLKENYAALRPAMVEWAKTITFGK